ncbi:hypothetical protein IPA_07435 [Ignicoccus pacificus DSM 13166]|uniref:Uncharacterized protein n=1 Tax=Ignicoccus pacificus DSM 13166 TaxID=940294 RepID=A0A977PKB4_9CREN|nr:hypothetical protein IPA_07435 [Ignicoccus pacificus DSM 13166]
MRVIGTPKEGLFDPLEDALLKGESVIDGEVEEEVLEVHVEKVTEMRNLSLSER